MEGKRKEERKDIMRHWKTNRNRCRNGHRPTDKKERIYKGTERQT